MIQINLNQVPSNVASLGLILNSFSQQNFGEIPFAGIRIHNGKAGSGNVFATFDVANDPTFAGKVSMIMGSVYRHNGGWKFRSIGAAIPERELKSSLAAYSRDYAS